MQFFAISPDRWIPASSIRALRRVAEGTQIAWGDGARPSVEIVHRPPEEILAELEGWAPRPQSRDARLLAAIAAARTPGATSLQRSALDFLRDAERLLGLDGGGETR